MTILDGKLQGVTSLEQCFATSEYANYIKAYFATEPNKLMPVVVKALRVTPGEAMQLRDNIKMRLAVWENLTHPNVAPFLGLYEDDYHLVALVLPYYENRNVLHYMKNNPTSNKLSFIKGVAEGLKYLHSQSPPIIHGDVRGSNVLVDDSGAVRLVDFGLVHVMNGIAFTTSNILGPARWQAPEVLFAEESLPFTCESDVYSFSMFTVEVLTEDRPYSGISDIGAMRLVQAGKRPRRPTNMPLADDIWHILEKCWDAEPDARPSMSEVCEMFQTRPDVDATSS